MIAQSLGKAEESFLLPWFNLFEAGNGFIMQLVNKNCLIFSQATNTMNDGENSVKRKRYEDAEYALRQFNQVRESLYDDDNVVTYINQLQGIIALSELQISLSGELSLKGEQKAA